MAVHSSVVDYSLTSADHSRLPVMVVPLGELNAPLFTSMMEALGSCPAFQVADVKGPSFVSFKFLTNTTLPRWAQARGDWSEFTAHKQILGVIAVCQCMDEEEFQDMAARFKTACNANAGVCDSRCLVFGPEQALCHLVDIRKGFVLVDVASEQVADTETVDVWMVHRVLSDYAVTMHAQLCARLREFGRSFGLIEKKVVSERQLYSPLEGERKPLSRNHRKARALKHLGDLHQLAGQSQEAVTRYTRAVNMLRSRNDYLWMAAALEGMACAADLHRRSEELLTAANAGGVDLESGHYIKARSLSRRRAGRIHTNSPMMEQRHASPVPSIMSRGIPQEVEEMRIDLSDSPLPSPRLKRDSVDPFEDTTTISPGESMSTITSDELSGVEGGTNGVLFGEEMREGSPVSVVFREDGAAPGYGSEGEEEESGVFEEEVDGVKVRLDRAYTTSKYHEALYYYVKAGKDGGIPFVESLLKFAKFLAESKSYERANEALHRLFNHKFLLCPEDQVQLIKTIASVYRSIHFHRNAAMYTCIAANQAMEVAKTTSNSQLHYFTAYHLLMDSLSGYQMSLDPEDMQEVGRHCWPQIQARLLLKLLALTHTLQQNSLVIRHASFLLQYLYNHLSEADLQRVTELLQSAAHEREAGQEDRMLPFISMATQDKPIVLSKIPTVQSFVPQPLSEALKPHRYHGYTPPPSPSSQSSPFIFSALQYTKEKKKTKEIWVSKTPVEVYVEITNPLPFQIQVEDLRLWAESTSVALDTTRTSLTLPPGGEPQQLTLYVIPHGTGEVQVHGYRAQVFGIKSLCRVWQGGSQPSFTVLPTLPILRVRPKLLPPPTLSRLTSEQILQLPDLQEPMCLLDGEGSTLALMLDTSRESHVTRLSLTLVSPPCERCSLAWSEEELSSVLPLAPHSRCYILLKAHAHFPTHARVLLSDSEVEGEDPGGGSHNTATLDPHRLSYDGSSQSLKPPPVTSTFSKVTRLMDRLRSSSSSKIKGLHSAKSSTMVAKQRYREQTPPISHGSLTMPRSTLQQSVSVTSLRSHTGDTPTRRCFTPSGSPDGSDDTDDVVSVYSSGGPNGSGRSSASSQGTAYPDPRKRRSVSIAAELGSLLDIFLSQPGRQIYEARYVAEYTGGPGAKEGYYRRLDFTVSVQVQPSFVFGQFCVEPHSSDDQFMFAFSALNCSTHTLQLLLSVDKDLCTGDSDRHLSWEFEAKYARRIAIPLKKFNIEEKGSGESLNPDLYSERITSCIHLTWQNRSLGRRGTTSLKGFPLQPPALTLVRPQQLTFSLLVNGKECSRECQIRVEVGRKAVVRLTVTNTSGSLLSHVVVQLGLCQEVEGRVVDRRLEGKVIHSSSLSMQVPRLAPDEKFSLNTTLMFVCVGVYQLQPVCCVPRATASPPSEGVPVREWTGLLGVEGNVPEFDAIRDTLTDTVYGIIEGTSSEVHNKRLSHRSHSTDGSRSIPIRKRIEHWKQISGDKDTPPTERRDYLSSSGTPPPGDMSDGPLPVLASTNQVDETLSCLHGDSTVPQLSELLSVQQRGGSTVEVKPTLSVSPKPGNQATSNTKTTDVCVPTTVSMATPRTRGVPVADRSVSVCAGPKVGVSVELRPHHTTAI